MRSIGLWRFGLPDVLKVLELPDPHPGRGQVRVRVTAAAVNPSDTILRSGWLKEHFDRNPFLGEFPRPPYVPGWDVAGIVDEVGNGIGAELAVGTPVLAVTLPVGGDGAYSQYVVVNAASVVSIRDGFDPVAACTLPMNGLTAQLALDRLELGGGMVVGVTGAAGVLGGYVVQLAKARGLTVLADSSDDDHRWVSGLGADHVLPRGTRFGPAVRDVVPRGVDGVVDCAIMDGDVAPSVADGGTVVTLRRFTGDDARGISWRPVYVKDYLERTDKLVDLRDRVEAGDVTLRVADRYRAEDAADAHRRLEAGGVRGRLVLTFDDHG